jgi:hypothetical protein
MNAIAMAVKKVMKNKRAQYRNAITMARLMREKACVRDGRASNCRATKAIVYYKV